MTTEDDKPNLINSLFGKFTLSEAIILAIAPVICSSILFVAEWGYFSVFSLPLQFINFDISEIFIITSALIAILIVVLLTLKIIKPFYTSIVPVPLRKHIGMTLPIYAVFIALGIIYSGIWKEYIPFFIAMIVFSIKIFLPPFITKKVKGSYSEKFLALEELNQKKHDQASEKSLTENIVGILGPKAVFALLIYSLVLFTAYHVGRGNALKQEDFRIVNTDPETVVLYIKPDRVIASPFDRISKEIEPIFQVLYLDNDSLEFTLEKVGPLHMKNDDTFSIPSNNPSSTSQPTQVDTETPILQFSPSTLPCSTATHVP